mmetsp:Transcript_46207/g.95526  ORF Transcript_46207/g.95526 Transcript_46207/m.95526 type:complete len:215 (+) Transcript_46207:804-1448(+)
MDLLTMLVGVPRKAHELRELFGIAGLPQEVISAESSPLLLVLEVSERILSHGPGLRIVVGGVHVQVQKVLGSVFPDSQIPGRGPQLVVLCCNGRGRFVEVLELLAQVLVVGSLAVAVGIGVCVRISGVRVSGVCVIVVSSFCLSTQLSPSLFALLLQQLLLSFQALFQLRALFHLRGFHAPSLSFDPLPLLDDLLVVVCLEAVPAVALAVVVQV